MSVAVPLPLSALIDLDEPSIKLYERMVAERAGVEVEEDIDWDEAMEAGTTEQAWRALQGG